MADSLDVAKSLMDDIERMRRVNEQLYFENVRMAALIGEIEAVLADVEDGHDDPLDLQGELRRIFRQGAPDD